MKKGLLRIRVTVITVLSVFFLLELIVPHLNISSKFSVEAAEVSDELIIANDESGIPDTNLYNEILRYADSNNDKQLTVQEAAECTRVGYYFDHEHHSTRQIKDLTGIEYLVNLTYLDLYDNFISDISRLKALPNLTYLDLGYNHITDISVLNNCSNLTHLYISENPISDMGILSDLIKLQYLAIGDINKNDNIDASMLKELPELTYLNISGETVNVEDLEKLETVVVYGNKITINNLPNTTYVEIQEKDGEYVSISNLPKVEDVVFDVFNMKKVCINNCDVLKSLMLPKMSIEEIKLDGLPQLIELNIKDNEVMDISSLENVVSLASLNLSGNRIKDISALKNLNKLENLDLRNNLITKEEAEKNLPTKFIELELEGKSWFSMQRFLNDANVFEEKKEAVVVGESDDLRFVFTGKEKDVMVSEEDVEVVSEALSYDASQVIVNVLYEGATISFDEENSNISSQKIQKIEKIGYKFERDKNGVLVFENPKTATYLYGELPILTNNYNLYIIRVFYNDRAGKEVYLDYVITLDNTEVSPILFEEYIPELLLGDLDEDGEITLEDAQEVLKLALGIGSMDDAVKILADADEDGKVNLNDAQKVLRLALGIL